MWVLTTQYANRDESWPPAPPAKTAEHYTGTIPAKPRTNPDGIVVYWLTYLPVCCKASDDIVSKPSQNCVRQDDMTTQSGRFLLPYSVIIHALGLPDQAYLFTPDGTGTNI